MSKEIIYKCNGCGQTISEPKVKGETIVNLAVTITTCIEDQVVTSDGTNKIVRSWSSEYDLCNTCFPSFQEWLFSQIKA